MQACVVDLTINRAHICSNRITSPPSADLGAALAIPEQGTLINGDRDGDCAIGEA
jgi:hypothetical protein